MREPTLELQWPATVRQVHQEHRQFCDPALRPNVFSWYHERTRLVVGLIQRFAPDARRILDVGCAQGTIAITLGEMGYEVTGNDIRDHYLAYAAMRDDQNKVDFKCCNFLDLECGVPFDVIVFTEVIEHVTDHATFLEHMRQCLRPGGILIVTTPNHGYFPESLPSFKELDLAEHGDKQFSADGSDHFYLFTKIELGELLQQSGFSVVHHEFFLPFIQYGYLRSALLWRVLPVSLLERISGWMSNHNRLCAQQCVVAKRAP